MFQQRHSLPNMELARGLVRAAVHPHHRYSGDVTPPSDRIFLTVSRQAGSGAMPLAREVVRRLNESPGADWTAWDQELVEKVSSEHHIEAAVVDLMEDRQHNWLQEFVDGISSDSRSRPDELKVYRQVATTIRALAAAGHAAIVGRGGAFITAGLPGGIHVRLVSPLANRIAHLAKDHGVSEKEAAARVARIDRTRKAFYRRFWPAKPLGPESFTMTLNTSELSLDEMGECVVALIHFREQHSELRHAQTTTAGGAAHAGPELHGSGAV